MIKLEIVIGNMGRYNFLQTIQMSALGNVTGGDFRSCMINGTCHCFSRFALFLTNVCDRHAWL